jgi:glycosyltransferase involved in cell wall biosynthesis
MASANYTTSEIRQHANGRPIVAHVIYTFDMGGAQRRIVDLINDPVEGAYHVIIPLDGKTGAAKAIQAFDTHTLLNIDWQPQPVHRAIPKAWRILRDLKPDVVCGYNWAGAEWSMAARLCGIKRVFQIEDGFSADETVTLSHKRGCFRRVLLLGSGRVKLIVVSHTLRKIAEDIWCIPPEKIHHIPNGVDIDFIQAGAKRSAPLMPAYTASNVILGWLGALRPEKRIDRLLKAFGALELEALATLRTTFIGIVDDPAAYLNRLDGLVLTSETEQTPYVLMEAMAAGLPCLTTDVGDCRRMLSEESDPFIVRNPDDLEQTLKRFIDDADLRQKVGEANRAKAEREFDIDKMRERYREIF